MAKYRFAIVLVRDEDGMFIASCPALEGCYSQGKTLDEAVRNIQDAIRANVRARLEAGESIPTGETLLWVEVEV